MKWQYKTHFCEY